MLLKVWNMLNKPWHITTHFNMTRAKRNIVCYIAIIIRFFLIITARGLMIPCPTFCTFTACTIQGVSSEINVL